MSSHEHMAQGKVRMLKLVFKAQQMAFHRVAISYFIYTKGAIYKYGWGDVWE